MKNTTRFRRLRNAHQHDEKHQEPFFSQSSEHDCRPFFNAQQGGVGQTVQAKLTLGKPGDRYEQEADRAANNVVARNGQTPGVQRQEPGSVQRVTLMSPAEDEKLGTAEARMERDKLIQEKIQTKEKEEEEPVQAKEKEEEKPVQTKEKEEEKPVQTKKKKEEEEPVQAKEKEEEEPVQAKEEGRNVVNPGVSQKIKKAAGAGQPLSGEILAEMEHMFGADFSGVNIHTDAEAVRLNEQLHSQAFTRGQDIFFNEGMYRPETSEGKRLLAHELAHVVQQCGRKLAAESKKSK
ncbi:DUF4157 domain-containing protein [Nitrosomonas sp.]|uniref:eCIS core domain-containing protein n=1 Tax=Nitrosomonas sp. TaxID=42353 RepID=UPI0026253DDA|nr:DUF4157 domain-containing protein [Nitrosomonas sp.]MCW5599991.1 DUF4157 domain-containing protein [Nitrosomonas sp.]